MAFGGALDRQDMRYDLKIIASWIDEGAKVLGLGCGDGELLLYLKEQKHVDETGIEIKEPKVIECIHKGLSVLQGDINEEILDYPDNCFDYVILSQTLQQVYKPLDLITAMLRVGKKSIVSFPNFCHWKIRLQLLTSGHVPITRELPFEWHDTPNIRVLGINDFNRFSKTMGCRILRKAAIDSSGDGQNGKIIRFIPNLFATYGLFMIGK